MIKAIARKLASLAIVSPALLVVTTPAQAGEQVGTVSSPLVIDKSVEIINGSNRLLRFDIRPDDGPWKTYAVAAGANTEIHCHGTCATGGFHFRIMTNSTPVQYLVRFTKRYILHWNAARQVWDLSNYTG